MDERIERFLQRIEPSTEAKLKRSIGSRARNGIRKEALRTQFSPEDFKSYVENKYWKGRVKPVLQTLLEKLYYKRDDLLPGVSEKQIYSIASKVRGPSDKTTGEIEPTFIPENRNKLIVSPAIALIYGIRDGDVVEFSSEKHYGKVRKQTKVEEFNGNADLTVKLFYEDMKLIFGLDYLPQLPINVKYKIRKIVGTTGLFGTTGPDVIDESKTAK